MQVTGAIKNNINEKLVESYNVANTGPQKQILIQPYNTMDFVAFCSSIDSAIGVLLKAEYLHVYKMEWGYPIKLSACTVLLNNSIESQLGKHTCIYSISVYLNLHYNNRCQILLQQSCLMYVNGLVTWIQFSGIIITWRSKYIILILATNIGSKMYLLASLYNNYAYTSYLCSFIRFAH